MIPFAGALFGVVWFAFIGLVSTISIAITSGVYDANNSDPSTIASRLGLGVVALMVIIIMSMTANAVNLMAAGSAISNIFSGLKLKHSLWIAAIFATFVTFIPMVVGSFLNAFTAFLDYVGMVSHFTDKPAFSSDLSVIAIFFEQAVYGQTSNFHRFVRKRQ